MYDQIRVDPLFIMLYGVVTAVAMMASCYLPFRRSNAIAPDVTSPMRLRRWTGVFFAAITLNHLWYMPLFFFTASVDVMMIELVGGMLDNMTVVPLAIVVLFAMLQDRRRPLWPIALMAAPIILGMGACVVTRSVAFYPAIYAYVLLLAIGLKIYMIRSTRQYGRWLRDNYADWEAQGVVAEFLPISLYRSDNYYLCKIS